MLLRNHTLAPPGEGSKTLSFRERLRFCLRTLNDRGQSLVEFALCVPILLLILTGIFGCGWAFNNYLMLTDAVSIGARYMAVNGGLTTDPCATAAGAVYNAAPYLVQTKLKFTFILNGTTYGPYTKTTGSSPTSVSCSSTSLTTGAARNLAQGNSAQLIVSYPCTITVYGANIGCTLTAMTTELVQ